MRRFAKFDALFAFLCGIPVASLAVLYYEPKDETKAEDLLDALPSSNLDLGSVKQGEVITNDFTLINRGSKPIKIINIGTTCGCTSAHIDKKIIMVGESSKLAVKFSSGVKRGPFRVRAIVLYIVGDVAVARSKTIWIKGKIDPDFAIKPESLTLSEPGKLSGQITLEPENVASLKVLSVKSDKRFIRCGLVESFTNQSAIRVDFVPDQYYANAGPPHVVVHTDSPHQPIARIPVHISQKQRE